MNRREFLKKSGTLVLALPLAGKAVVEVLGGTEELLGYHFPDSTGWSNTDTADFTYSSLVKSKGLITQGHHPKALWPGVEQWFNEKYDLFEDFKALYGPS